MCVTCKLMNKSVVGGTNELFMSLYCYVVWVQPDPPIVYVVILLCCLGTARSSNCLCRYIVMLFGYSQILQLFMSLYCYVVWVQPDPPIVFINECATYKYIYTIFYPGCTLRGRNIRPGFISLKTGFFSQPNGRLFVELRNSWLSNF